MVRNRPFLTSVIPNRNDEAFPPDTVTSLIKAQEDQRSRVARELHDNVCQQVALLQIELAQFRQMVTDEPTALQRFHGLQNRVSEISFDLHLLTRKLRDSMLDHMDLASALKSLCRDIAALGTVKVEFRQTGDLTEPSKDVKLCAFKIVQEALRNCTEHSGAESAQVVVTPSVKTLGIVIMDDGQGFDTQSEAICGLGFTSMYERTRILGGRISITSKPGHGTLIRVSLPLKSESEKNQETLGVVLDWQSSPGSVLQNG
jgi:signal transduction histidine kinase